MEVTRGLGSSCIVTDVLGVLNYSFSSGKSGSCEDREDDEEHENVAHGGVRSGWKMACELHQSHCTALLCHNSIPTNTRLAQDKTTVIQRDTQASATTNSTLHAMGPTRLVSRMTPCALRLP